MLRLIDNVPMPRYFDTRDPEQFGAGIEAAVDAARSGELVAIATESTYAIATDAFRSSGLSRIRHVKDRDESMPIPVLIASRHTVAGVTTGLSDAGQALIDRFWPGLLTIVARAQPALSWDVGGIDRNLVSARMPVHQVAWRLAFELGPLGTTAANRGRAPAPTDCAEVQRLFGDAVAVYLDSGPSGWSAPSTVVDVTADRPRLVRRGAVTVEQLREVSDLLDLADTADLVTRN